MSFTAEIKSELAKKNEQKKCCTDALIRAIILVDGSIHLQNKKITLELITENAAVAKRIKQMLQERDILVELVIRKSNLARHGNYLVKVKGNNLLKELQKLKVTDENGVPLLDFSTKDFNKCCVKSFLKGLFLAGGYISSPEKEYKLQLMIGNYNLAKEITSFLKQNGFKPSIIEAKRDYHVNISNRKGILKFLLWIDAPGVLLEFENVQIIKDMKNYTNRLVNSETANLKKTANSAQEQINAIKYIKAKKRYDKMPEPLKGIAYLRLSFPSLTLEELGKKNRPVLSKSAVNHRLRRIKKKAQRLGY